MHKTMSFHIMQGFQVVHVGPILIQTVETNVPSVNGPWKENLLDWTIRNIWAFFYPMRPFMYSIWFFFFFFFFYFLFLFYFILNGTIAVFSFSTSHHWLIHCNAKTGAPSTINLPHIWYLLCTISDGAQSTWLIHFWEIEVSFSLGSRYLQS